MIGWVQNFFPQLDRSGKKEEKKGKEEEKRGGGEGEREGGEGVWGYLNPTFFFKIRQKFAKLRQIEIYCCCVDGKW